jgi:hypothetical protein
MISSCQFRISKLGVEILLGHGLKVLLWLATISRNSASPSHEWTPPRVICLWQFLHQWAPHPAGQSNTVASLKSSASRGVLTLHLHEDGVKTFWMEPNERTYFGHSTEMEKLASSILFHCANTASSAPTISAIQRDTTVGTTVRRATKPYSQILTSSPRGSVGTGWAENGPSRLLDLGLYVVQEALSADRTFLAAGFDLHQVPTWVRLRANRTLERCVLLLHPLQGLEFRDSSLLLFFHLFCQLK